MASIRNEEKRNIIPLWRSYDESARMGELAYTGKSIVPVRFDRFGEFLAGWQEHQTITSAADLINAAVASDNTKLPDVIKAAEFMLKNREECSPLAIDVALFLLEKPVNVEIEKSENKLIKFEDRADALIFDLDNQEIKTKARIGQLRQQVHNFCHNAIAYCELARCYADLGLNEKAEFYMNCAVQLAPHNRFVSRCAARFFVHIGDTSKARKILNNNGWINIDPWLMASEIAVTSVMKRSSRHINSGRKLVLSDNISPYSSSELCFAICKEDYKAGKRKDWQRMFGMGLRDPNDNSLAQAEYIAKAESKNLFDYGRYRSIARKDEADTRNFIVVGNYEEAFLSSINWMRDFRFSSEPISFAFDLSCNFLKKYDYSVAVIKRWLDLKPQDFVMTNNMIYALGLSDKTEEAEQYYSKINVERRMEENADNGICLLATKGLIEYRKKNIEEGRAYYQLSIDTAKRLRKKNLADKARLNMIREEVHCCDDYDPNILKELDSLNTGFEDETEQLKKDIHLEVEKRKK